MVAVIAHPEKSRVNDRIYLNIDVSHSVWVTLCETGISLGMPLNNRERCYAERILRLSEIFDMSFCARIAQLAEMRNAGRPADSVLADAVRDF